MRERQAVESFLVAPGRVFPGIPQARRTGRGLQFLGVGLAYFIVAFLLVQAGIANNRTDHPAHLAMALDGDLTYSLVFPFVRFIAGYVAPLTALLIVAAGFLAVRSVVSYSVLRSADLSARTAFVGTGALFLAMPLPAPRPLFHRDINRLEIYLGQLSPNQWHNSTTFAMVALAVPFVVVWMRDAQVGSFDRFDLRGLLLPALLLALATLAKPNFSLVAIPAAALFLLVDRTGSVRTKLVRFATMSLPSLGILAIQQRINFGQERFEPGRAVLIIDILAQWREFSDSIPSSLVRSLLFPVLVLAVHAIAKQPTTRQLRFAWLLVGVSAAQFALLSERGADGATIFHGNWSWAVLATMYVLFLYSLRDVLRLDPGDAPGRSPARLLRNASLAALGLHVLSGAIYLVVLVGGHNILG